MNVEGALFIILAVLSFIVTVFIFATISDDVECVCNDDCKKKKILHKTFAVIWSIFMIYCLICSTIAGKNKGVKTELPPYATEHIIALQDSNNINGKFYFRYGYIETSLYLNYIVDVGNNKYVPNSIPFDNVTIIPTNDEPKIEWYKERSTKSIFYKETTKYYLYIPEGMVMTDIVIDLK